MSARHIFISHASEDDAFVAELRRALEDLGLPVWVDSRNLRAGDRLHPEIARAIETARQVIAVLSPAAVNSPWVKREIDHAREVERQRRDQGYRVIPLLLPGIEPPALGLWFAEEPLAVPVRLGPGGLAEALPAILAALSERLPTDHAPFEEVAPPPLADLVLELTDPRFVTDAQGRRRVQATARLTYYPADPAVRPVESPRYTFTAPLGPLELDDLRWYLERYALWPTGVFRQRAQKVEAQLPRWGQALYAAALGVPEAQEPLRGWLQAADRAERRFSVKVEADLPAGSPPEAQAAANRAASALLALPWELLHDDRGYLFHGRRPVRVRRRLPNRHPLPPTPADLPLRVLLISPRPEDDRAPYIDHRVSALPLVTALEALGGLVELTVVTPGTFPALTQALARAAEEGRPFHVVHFDGHGVFDPQLGLGALVFEHPQDADKPEHRRSVIVPADDLAAVFRDHRVPLVFLEACQSAQAEEDPTASVAARLLEQGVASVIAMSHSVLVETSRRFVAAFYRELTRGATVGRAMLAAQRDLATDTFRGRVLGAGELHLQDWFVPVLYQEEQDPVLVTRRPPEEVQRLEARRRQLRLGDLPDPPAHTFVGRSRDLLALERLLERRPYAVVRGPGGVGKTTLAAELARWLVRTRRFDRAAFVSLEAHTGAREALDALGRQLLPKYSVALYDDLEQALQSVTRALNDHRTLIVLDNLESVLPPPGQSDPEAETQTRELLTLARKLLDAAPATRLLFTTREPLPEPFADPAADRPLGPLPRDEAVRLVEQVLTAQDLTPPPEDPGRNDEEITALVEAVHGHPRALVLLAPEVAREGVRAATARIREIMARLHARYPDDRQRSLFASVELSLRRLPPEVREQIKVLVVFHGGAHLLVLAHLLGREVPGKALRRMAQSLGLTPDGEVPERVWVPDFEAAQALARDLITVGLAEDAGYGHLRLDPALPAYLARDLDPAERETLTARWAEAMTDLVNFLYQQQFQDAHLAQQLALRELPNLLALLDWAAAHRPPEAVVDLADSVESLLADLGRPRALARAAAHRRAAAQKLGADWSHARYLAESAAIDRLLERGDLTGAYAAAQALLRQAQAAGEEAYPGAAYDLALAHLRLGRVLEVMGRAEEALAPLEEAQRRFARLAGQGITEAARMAAAALTERADALLFLGRLEKAAAAYEETIRLFERLEDKRSVAAAKGQLATVRMLQGRYEEAIEGHAEARAIFEALNEPRSVATAWHQMGMAYRRAGRYEQAEEAYCQALAIFVRHGYRSEEAGTLTELGNLYGDMGRLEEAAAFYRRAAEIHAELGDLLNEGRDHSNLARVLLGLRRYAEARQEIQRALECLEPFGPAAEPWRAWDILHDLEQAEGRAEAAARARQKAIEAYLAYRRQGGYPQTPSGQLCALVAQAIQRDQAEEAERQLAQLLQAEDAPPYYKETLLPKLQAVLRGARDPALAADPALEYHDAAELLLLLESLEHQ